MKYGFYHTEALGYLKIGYCDEVVLWIQRVKQIDEKDVHSALSDKVFMQLQEYMNGERKSFAFPYELHGTPFQKRVWNALCEIPYGETRTYGEIAKAVGNPKACRAVGMANHNNPIAIVVPCHRVIGANGKLTGYGGGLDMKEYLLELEKKQNSLKR